MCKLLIILWVFHFCEFWVLLKEGLFVFQQIFGFSSRLMRQRFVFYRSNFAIIFSWVEIVFHGCNYPIIFDRWSLIFMCSFRDFFMGNREFSREDILFSSEKKNENFKPYLNFQKFIPALKQYFQLKHIFEVNRKIPLQSLLFKGKNCKKVAHGTFLYTLRFSSK